MLLSSLAGHVGGAFARVALSGEAPHPLGIVPLGGLAPGDVAVSESLAPRLLRMPLPGTAWAQRIAYCSTRATGEPMLVTGAVIAPTRPPRALVALAPGTQGLSDCCSSSHLLGRGGLYEAMAIAFLLRRGCAVAITDYEGLGGPGEHTYVVGRSEGTAVLDVLRAASRVLASRGIDVVDLPMAITGYSQGGGAALWAAGLHDAYAPELPVRAIAAGGVPADLPNLVETLEDGPYASLLFMAASGFDAAYSELALSDYLNERGRTFLARARVAALPEVLTMAPFLSVSDLTHTNPLISDIWQARLRENDPTPLRPKVPTFLYHARQDMTVAAAPAQRLAAEWRRAGVPITWRSFAGEHITGYALGLRWATHWLLEQIMLPQVSTSSAPMGLIESESEPLAA